MARTSPSLRFTVSDLELFPDDSQRYEIIDGELFVSKAAHYRHHRASARITIHLGNWSLETGLGEVLPTPGVVFTEADAVIPDLVWVSHDRLALLADEVGHLRGAPELVVEVLSPGVDNERRDREAKLKLYSAYGVAEYWIVDWRLETVAVYRRQRARLRLVTTLGYDDKLTSPLLPGFALPIAQLFPRD
jgi:Uma2 family endonuclease